MAETDPPSPPRPSRWRLLLRALLTLLGFLALGLLGLGVWLTDARLTELARAQLEARLAGRFELGAVSWQLPLRFELRDLVAHAPEGPEVLRLRRLALELRAAKLLDAELWVDALELSGLELLYSTSTTGLDLARAFAPKDPDPVSAPVAAPAPRAPLPIRVRGVALDARLRLRAHGWREDVTVALRGAEADWRERLELRIPEVSLAGATFGVTSTAAAELVLLPASARRARLRLGLTVEAAPLAASSLLASAPAIARTLARDLDPRRLDVALDLAGDELRVERAQLGLASGALQVTGRLALAGPQAGRHQLAVELEHADLPSALRGVAGPAVLPRRLSASARLEGPGLFQLETRLALALEAVGRPAALPAAAGEVARLSLAAAGTAQAVRVERLALELGSTRLSASGSVPLAPEGTLALAAELQDPDVGRLLDAPHTEGWHLRARAVAKGTRLRPELTGALELRPGALGLAEAKLELSPERRLAGAVRLRGLPLAPLSSGSVTGTVSAQLDLGGRLDAPEATGKLEVHALGAAGLSFERAELALRLGPTLAQVEALRLVPRPRGAGELRGRASYGLKTGKVEARLEGRALEARLLAPLSPEAGRLGRLGDLDLVVEGDRASLSTSLTFVGPLLELELGGVVEPQRSRVDLRSSGQLRDLAGLAPAFGVDASGAVDFELRARGPLSRPRLSGRLAAAQLGYGVRRLRDLSLRVETSTGALPYRVRASVERAVRVQADLGLHPARARARVQIDRYSPSGLLPELEAAGLALELGGEAEVDYGPRRLVAKAQLPRLSLVRGDQRIETKVPLQLRFDGETAWIDGWSIEGPDSALSLSGRLSEESMAVSGRGRLGLAWITPFVPALVEAEGALSLELELAGTPRAPSGLVAVSVTDPIRLLPRGLPMDVELARGQLRWRGAEVRVEDLSGSLGAGRFTLAGTIGLRDLLPHRYDLRFEGRGLPFRTRDLSIEANAELRLGGEGLVPDVSGRIDLVRGRVLRRFKLHDLQLSSEPDLSAPLSETAPQLGAMNLDLAIESSAGIDVLLDLRTLAVNLSLETALRVQGTPLAPRVEGKVSVPRGQLRFPAGTLNVNRASVDFQPGRGGKLGGEVDLEAEGDIESKGDEVPYFVGVRLVGDLAEMDLSLSAQPFLEEREVLLLLLTGYAGFQGAEGDSRARDAALALAGTQLVGPVADFVSDELDALFNLDVKLGLEVTGSGVRVSAQKDITRRLRLEGAYATGDGATGRSATARARFFLLDRLTLESSFRQLYGSQTSGGGGTDEAEQKLELKLRVLGY